MVLEAMAVGLPVIATNWGRPADYLNSRCGILVKPASKEGFVKGLTDAMLKLAQSPELQQSMGSAGGSAFGSILTGNGKSIEYLKFINKRSTLARSLR